MARNFRELEDKMNPDRRAAVEARVQATLAAMRAEALRKGEPFPGDEREVIINQFQDLDSDQVIL